MSRIAVLALGMMLLAGCATSPVERQQSVTDSLTDVKNDMTAARTQLNSTIASLNSLVQADPNHLVDAYQQYASDVSALNRRAEDIRESRGEMREHRDDWLAEWSESFENVQNRELKQVSEERRGQIASRFNDIATSLDQANDSLRPLLHNLDDVRQVVGNDLTERGVSAVAGTSVVNNAYSRGTEINNILNDAIDNVEGLISVLEPANE